MKTEKTKKQKNKNTSSQSKPKVKKPSQLKVMFLGGVGEIGKNMTLFEYEDTIIILDCGNAFPSGEMPGIDLVIPDFSYLSENSHKIKALLLTHGHEDHIGAVPFLLKEFPKIPVYGTKLTLGLLQNKLVEHEIFDVDFREVDDRNVLRLGAFLCELIHVSHSIAGALAVVLTCPLGRILHTGDFKIDYTPLGNEIMNLNRFAEVGKQGVLLMLSDSTNVEREGYTLSESVVGETLNKLFAENKQRRIIVATFASNVDRVGTIINLAIKYKRKIAFSGKSMIKAIETAERIGYLHFDHSNFVDLEKASSIEDGKLLVLATGTQGEPMSSLTRMATNEFPHLKVGVNDTIILSSSQIPGNERDVYNVINNLYRLGAKVIYNRLEAIHASGHACLEELKLMLNLVKPKFFIPVHGEYRHLKIHGELAESLGTKKKNVILPELGDCVVIENGTIKKDNPIPVGNVFVDGFGVGDVTEFVLKDRLTLSEDGILIAVLGINRNEKTIVNGPEVITRGCFTFGDDKAMQSTEEIKKLIRAEFETYAIFDNSISSIKQTLQKSIRKYFKGNFKRHPMILPIILEM